jgi:hypothetical protein
MASDLRERWLWPGSRRLDLRRPGGSPNVLFVAESGGKERPEGRASGSGRPPRTPTSFEADVCAPRCGHRGLERCGLGGTGKHEGQIDRPEDSPVSFTESPRAAGRNGQKAGPPASETHPDTHLLEVRTCARNSGHQGPGLERAGREPVTAGLKLTAPRPTGKFDQVAPRNSREARPGARLILENSTVCQKSTN